MLLDYRADNTSPQRKPAPEENGLGEPDLSYSAQQDLLATQLLDAEKNAAKVHIEFPCSSNLTS